MSKLTLGIRACGVFLLWATAAVALPAQTFTKLHSFNGTDGAFPDAALVQAADGNLYGTTPQGGASDACPYEGGCGTVFTITSSGVLTTLYNFCSQGGDSCTDGANPNAALVQAADGNFYSTTSAGGATGAGTVFKITPSGTLTTLHSFDGTDGSLPIAGLVHGTDGNFYGTTEIGGANGEGTVFKISPSGMLTTLYNFCSQGDMFCTDGSLPYAGLVQGTDGNFYGTTELGGASGSACIPGGCGTVFSITASGTLTTLHSFDGIDGASPQVGLVQSTDGNFYGTTPGGGGFLRCFGNGCGTVFSITPGGALATLYNFCSQSSCTDGAFPQGGLVHGTDGNFYGTTLIGGANASCSSGGMGCGTVFKITSTPPYTLTTLYNFCSQSGCTDGDEPFAGLVQGTDGNFYGTTFYGGTIDACTGQLGCGTVFSLSVGPQVTVSPSSLTFATQAVGATSAAQTVMLTNSGNATLTIASIMITGTNSSDFAQTNTCGASVAAGMNCTLSITFTPSSTGTISASVTLSDSALGSPQTIPLTGTGMDFSAPAVSPGVLTLAAGQSGTFAATVTPIPSNTTFSGPVTFTCSGPPQASTCTPGSAVTNADGSVTSTFTVTTMARTAVPVSRLTPPPTVPVRLLLTLGMLLSLGTFLLASRLHLSWLEGRRVATVVLVFVLFSCGILTACSSGGGSAGTPVGTYTLTVTASFGGLSHSSTLQLMVQ